MFRSLLNTDEIMSRFGNNCEVDLRIDLTVLKAQVSVIRLSKSIKDVEILKEITGINNNILNNILQNQNNIMSKWRLFCKNSLSSTHSDDCDGIDALLLEWISQCKMNNMKPSRSAIKTLVMNLADIVNVYPYYIKPCIWTRIEEIFLDESKVARIDKNYITFSILDILNKDGRRVLTPQTYQRFLTTIGASSFKAVVGVPIRKKIEKGIKGQEKHTRHPVRSTKEVKKQSTNTANNNYIFDTELNRKNSRSSVDLPRLKVIDLDSENEERQVITTKDEPLEYTDSETTANILSPELLKREIMDDNIEIDQKNFEEFISIKEEPETMENNKNDNIEEFISIKPEISDMSEAKTENVDRYLEVSNKQIRIEPNDGFSQEIQVNEYFDELVSFSDIRDNVTRNLDIEYSDNEEVVEIEDSDDDQLLEKVNFNCKTYSEKSVQGDLKIVENYNTCQESLDDDVVLNSNHFNAAHKRYADKDTLVNVPDNRNNGTRTLASDVAYNGNEEVMEIEDSDDDQLPEKPKYYGKTYSKKSVKGDLKVVENDNRCQETLDDDDDDDDDVVLTLNPADNDTLLNVPGCRDNPMRNLASDVEYNDNDEILEIQESDNELREELLETRNEYNKIYSIKYVKGDLKIVESDITQEPLDENHLGDVDDDVVTILEIVSDDEVNTKSDKELANMLESSLKSQIIPGKRLKRTRNEIEDNLPSTSHRSTCQLTKKFCSSSTESQDAVNISVRSKVEAYDCLHSIKKYFQSQNNKTGVALTTNIMKSFLLCDYTCDDESSYICT